MTVLVTGGTGHLGAWLVKKLAQQEQNVSVLVRNEDNASFLRDFGVKLIKGDITSKSDLVRAMVGVDSVYHLAALAKPWAFDKNLFTRINADGTRLLLQAAIESGVNRVLITSSAGNLGPGEHITENTVRAVPFYTEYEKTKDMADKIALEFADRIEIVLVMPTRVYGPVLNGKPASLTELVERIVGGFKLIPSKTNSIGNYVYVENVADGMMKAMERGRPGEKYILGGENKTLLQFYEEVRKNLGTTTPLIKIPMPLIRFVAWLQEIGSVFGMKPQFTSEWINKIEKSWIVYSDKAVKELNYDPGKFEIGIQKTVDYYFDRSKVELPALGDS